MPAPHSLQRWCAARHDTHVCSDARSIKSGHCSLQSFVASHMNCHGVIMSLPAPRIGCVFLWCECHDSLDTAYHSIIGNAGRSALVCRLSVGCHHKTASLKNLPLGEPPEISSPLESVSDNPVSPLIATQTLHVSNGHDRIPTYYSNKLYNPVQFVPKIKGCDRHRLTADFILCILPLNFTRNGTMGYL